MEDKIFPTPESKKEAVMMFRELLAQPGWLLVRQILDANIENLRSQLEDPLDESTIEDIKVMRRQLRFYIKVRNMPEDMIKDFTGGSVSVDPGLDPYDKTPEKK